MAVEVISRVAGVIRELGCDTVGLQEVDGRPGLQSASLQLLDLANATGMTPIPRSALDVELFVGARSVRVIVTGG